MTDRETLFSIATKNVLFEMKFWTLSVPSGLTSVEVRQCAKTCATPSKDQKIPVILKMSENTFRPLQWLFMRKQILKHKKIMKTFVPKIILQNYILYKGDPTYVRILPVDLGMPQLWVYAGNRLATCQFHISV